LCSDCEHELRFHDDAPRRVPGQSRGRAESICRAESDCRCHATRQQAFPTSLTRYELQARKELRDL
jgi:hypothetical protein